MILVIIISILVGIVIGFYAVIWTMCRLVDDGYEVVKKEE